MPVAEEPLWQLEQLLVTLAWSKLAGTQPAVVWQSVQTSGLAMWVADLPVAMEPLWQLTQVPSTLL